jgi:PPK2 family polyphosphate:nucleotide phosphotransferase
MSRADDRLAARTRVRHGRHFHLKDVDPGDTAGYKSKEHARDRLERGVLRLAALQERLYAQDRWAVLIVLQAMDAAGKDSTIEHVMSGVNPQGCEVTSFKQPSHQELNHDYLWRAHARVPERGRIGLFNRSYYEEVLVVRVHPELLEPQRLPSRVVSTRLFEERYADINAFEKYLDRNGVVVRKFFLHLSREEQRRRFLDRLDQQEKEWKFSLADVEERKRWDDYMSAYEDMIRATATPHAPWYVVPADHKWYARLVVSAAIVETLESLDLKFPTIDPAKRKELKAVRRALEKEEG